MIYIVAHLKIVRHIEIIMIKILKKKPPTNHLSISWVFFFNSLVFFFQHQFSNPSISCSAVFFIRVAHQISQIPNLIAFVAYYSTWIMSICWLDLHAEAICLTTSDAGEQKQSHCVIAILYISHRNLTDHGWKQDTILWLQ